VPSITIKEPSIAVNPSIAFKSPSLRPSLSIAVELPLCCPLPSCRAVHYRQVAIVPSFAVHCHCNHSPLASRLCHPLPSIAPKEPSRRPSPSSCHCVVHRRPLLSITVVIAVHRHCRRNRAVPCHLSMSRSAAPSIAIKEPSRRPLMSRRTIQHCQVTVHCCQSVHCFQFSVAPSIAVHCRPSP